MHAFTNNLLPPWTGHYPQGHWCSAFLGCTSSWMTPVASEKASRQNCSQKMLVEGAVSALEVTQYSCGWSQEWAKGTRRGAPKASSIGACSLSSLDILFILSLRVSAKSTQVLGRGSSLLALYKYPCILRSTYEDSKKRITVKWVSKSMYNSICLHQGAVLSPQLLFKKAQEKEVRVCPYCGGINCICITRIMATEGALQTIFVRIGHTRPDHLLFSVGSLVGASGDPSDPSWLSLPPFCKYQDMCFRSEKLDNTVLTSMSARSPAGKNFLKIEFKASHRLEGHSGGSEGLDSLPYPKARSTGFSLLFHWRKGLNFVCFLQMVSKTREPGGKIYLANNDNSNISRVSWGPLSDLSWWMRWFDSESRRARRRISRCMSSIKLLCSYNIGNDL